MFFRANILGLLLALLSFIQATVATFTWTSLPTEMTAGQTYTLSWTGAVGPVTIYMKKDPSPSSWRAYVYGGGSDTSFTYTVPSPAAVSNFETERTYIFAAWDSGAPNPAQEYDSAPIMVHAPAAAAQGSVSVRRREVGTWVM